MGVISQELGINALESRTRSPGLPLLAFFFQKVLFACPWWSRGGNVWYPRSIFFWKPLSRIILMVACLTLIFWTLERFWNFEILHIICHCPLWQGFCQMSFENYIKSIKFKFWQGTTRIFMLQDRYFVNRYRIIWNYKFVSGSLPYIS